MGRQFVHLPHHPKRKLHEVHYARHVAALEDKLVQRSVAAVLNAIYEEDFLGFSGRVSGLGAASMMRWMLWWSGSTAPM